MSTPETDRDAVLAVHREWWIANYTVDTERLQNVYVAGDERFLMHNRNGHPYFSLAELTQLWASLNRTLVSKTDMTIWKIEISGDLAYLTGAGDYENPGEHVRPVRFTEIYQRQVPGKPVWKMVHSHFSNGADFDVPRPAFGDTYAERGGSGYLPSGAGFSAISDWVAE